MFRKITGNRWSRALVYVLVFAMSAQVSGGLFPQRAHAQDAEDEESLMTRVAVVGFDNMTARPELLGEDHGISLILKQAVKMELEDKEKIEFTPADKVSEYIKDGEEITQDLALSVGEGLGVEQVIFGSVSNASVVGTEYANVYVDLYIYDVEKQTMISRSLVMGEVYRKGFSGTEEQLLELAILDGIYKAMDEAFANLYKYGVVTTISGNLIQTNLSERDGVSKGALIAILSGAGQVATIEVSEASVAYSRGEVVEVLERSSIKSGFKARLIYTPKTYKPSQELPSDQKKKGKRMNPLLLGVVIAAVAISLGGGSQGAEPPQPHYGAEVRSSRDGKASVYSPTGFNPDYIPNAPVEIDNLSQSDLSACDTATSCAQDICPVDGTAYNFTMATSPKDPNIPGGGYVISFDMSNITLSQTDIGNLYIATCNTLTGEWDLISSNYSRCSWMGNKYCVSGTAPHFTPYVVVIDNRPEPLPAPANFSVSCESQKVILSWEKIQDTNNTGYRVYNCDTSQCTGIKETISSPNTLTTEYSASNGVQYCYAVTGISSSPSQDETSTAIKCITPSDTGTCLTGITLLTPGNGANITTSPQFRFSGTGDSQFYLLTVKDKNNYVILSYKFTGEWATSQTSTTRGLYEYAFSSTSLISGDTYTWSVTGYKLDSTTVSSPTWSFIFQGTSTSGCVEDLDPPVLLTPENGMQIAGKSPTFVWGLVDNATKYIITVLDQDRKLVYEALVSTTSSTFPTSSGGTSLIDNKTYTWYVRALNECSTSAASEDFSFTKVAITESPLNAVQWVVPSEDFRDPIKGGDQYVELNWKPNLEANLYGYRVYRSETPAASTTSMTAIDTILLSQFGTPPPNAQCPTFFATTPGYCDVSVTNGTRYYYRVVAIDNGYTEGPDSLSQSIVLDLQRPTLIAPGSVTGETVTTNTPTFNWLPVNGSDVTYLLTLKDNATQVVLWQPSTQDTSIALESATVELKENSVYTWSVMAINTLVQSEPSQTFKFTKGATTQRPDPPNWCYGTSSNSCAGNPGGPPYEYDKNLPFDAVKVYWECVDTANGQPVSNISGYNLYRSTTRSEVANATPIFVSNYECEGQTGQHPQISYSETQMSRGALYYYMLEAIDTGGQVSNTSPVLEVRLDLNAPTIISPVYGQRIYDPYPPFEWLYVAGATQYKLIVSEKDTFDEADILWRATVPSDSSSNLISVLFADTAYAAPKTALKNPADPTTTSGTPYYWKVCAINSITTTDAGCTNKFQLYKNLKPPDLYSPSSGDSLSTNVNTFKWSQTPGAALYQIRVCKQNSSTSNCANTSNPIIYEGDTTDTMITLDSLNLIPKCDTVLDPNCTEDGLYTWQVRAVDEAGMVSGNWDQGVKASSFYKVDLPAPSLLTPREDEVLTPDWDDAICQDFYGNWTYSYNLYFSWQNVTEDEGSYAFKVVDIKASEDAGEEVIVYSAGGISTPYISTGTCSGDPAPIPLAAGRKYKWNVAANSQAFFVDSNEHEFSTGLPAPRLIGPQDGQQVILSANCDGGGGSLCVHFEWDGGTFGDVNQPGVIGASSYDIEIYSQTLDQYFECKRDAEPVTSGFRNVVSTFCDLSNGDDVFNNDVFTWRVRARDSSGESTPSGPGYPGPWSQTRVFTVLIPGPVLASPPPSGETCYDDHSIGEVMANCVDMLCVNPEFYWSPIPLSAEACYRIEVSDLPDFRNLVLVADSVNNPTEFYKEGGSAGYNAYKTNIANIIPMTNGVKYYWRIGASVPPEAGGDCGTSWIYSETWSFLKRPNSGISLSYNNVTYQGVTLNWQAPRNCQGDASDAISIPSVPPNGGEFVVYLIQGSALPTPSTPPESIFRHLPPTQFSLDVAEGLNAQTDYVFCVAVVDNSFYYTDGGHHGPFECVLVHTLEEPTVP